METTAAFSGLECTDCGTVHDESVHGRCPDCGGSLDPTYDYDGVDAGALARAPDRTSGVWSYDALLPFPAEAGISAAEGATPLVEAPRLAGELDVGRVVIKDEGRNPTGSFLDRGVSLALTAAAGHADAADIEPLAFASAGNSGQSAAAYAGRLDLRSYAFVPSRSAFSNKAMINVHGGEMRVVGGRYPQALAAVDEQLATDHYSLQEFTTPYRHEGPKTIAYELVADLDGDLPDAVFVPTATGELLVGLEKGFRELRTLGVTDAVPPLYAVQPAGCAPIATAWKRGIDAPEAWATPDTICGELEIPDPAGGALALDALAATDGDAVTVEDRDILECAATAARHEIVEMGVAGGAAPAGAWAVAEEDGFDGDETVVLLNTEAAMKTPDLLRSHLMGQGI
ncbi:threonine synthase [Haloferacaceae archaeon DSL9]